MVHFNTLNFDCDFAHHKNHTHCEPLNIVSLHIWALNFDSQVLRILNKDHWKMNSDKKSYYQSLLRSIGNSAPNNLRAQWKFKNPRALIDSTIDYQNPRATIGAMTTSMMDHDLQNVSAQINDDNWCNCWCWQSMQMSKLIVDASIDVDSWCKHQC